ncbi:uncharacterized protein LOC124460137 isoform X1 [Drosophila willistoni]|uniref:uncharacterized protein LOC124460137 isoform X1 n=1 Tax=Drosophila willistoni TaxID=7260 RepID=UPI001F0853E0|nr:uncharacterized protein LOC124460137 isoform X1 [Drosophila willistoni]
MVANGQTATTTPPPPPPSGSEAATTTAAAAAAAASTTTKKSGAMGIQSSAWLTAAAVAIYTARVLWVKLKKSNSTSDKEGDDEDEMDNEVDADEDIENWKQDDLIPAGSQSNGLRTTHKLFEVNKGASFILET